jgi:leucine dehydrogenase
MAAGNFDRREDEVDLDGGTAQLWDHEQVVFCSDPDLGLKAVIVIDSTVRGPGLGGVRLRPYATAEDALRECRRLASAMTLKNAFAELPFGGAKSVIIDAGGFGDRAAAMRRFGEFVAATGGRYLPGVDMGTSTDDLAAMGEAGAKVSCSAVDPSAWTARGVHAAIRAAVGYLDGASELDDLGVLTGQRVLIQGAGHVGRPLAELLADDGAMVLIADLDRERAAEVAEKVGGWAIDPADALRTPCDVLAPCAAARVVNAETAASLKCRVVAGAANDTLDANATARLLADRGITYVPDFVANAGGVIQIQAMQSGWTDEQLGSEVDRIGERVASVLEDAGDTGRTPLEVAEARAAQLAQGPAVAAAAPHSAMEVAA